MNGGHLRTNLHVARCSITYPRRPRSVLITKPPGLASSQAMNALSSRGWKMAMNHNPTDARSQQAIRAGRSPRFYAVSTGRAWPATAPSVYVTVFVATAGMRGPGSTMPTRFSGSAADS